MINMRRAVLLLPVYVVLMALVDSIFNSADFDTKNDLSWWLVVGFTVAALSVFLIVAWLLVQKARGNVPVQRERVYTSLFIALIISGFVDDGLRGLASLLFHSRTIWVSIPLSILSYVALLTVFVLILNLVAGKPSRSGTAELASDAEGN
jgi:quinol-cytochrome oxidoreductase complex cytochrome b subunit